MFLFKGRVLGDFLRMPPPGGITSNLARGGSARSYPMDTRLREKLTRLAGYLNSLGLPFAGVDVIGTKISEINVTSPTGLRTAVSLGAQIDFATLFQEWVQ